MPVPVRDISTFENGNAIWAHYAAVRNRIKTPKNIRPEPVLLQRDKTVKPLAQEFRQIPSVCVPKAYSVESIDARKQRLAKLYEDFCNQKKIAPQLLRYSDLPLEGLLLQAEFVELAAKTHDIEYRLIRDILGTSARPLQTVLKIASDFKDRRIKYDRNQNPTLNSSPLILDKLMDDVSKKYAISIIDIRRNHREKTKMLAQQEFIYLALEHGGKTKTQIAEYINRDRSCLAPAHASHKRRLDIMKERV